MTSVLAFQTLWDSANMGQGYGALAWPTADVEGDGKTEPLRPWQDAWRRQLRSTSLVGRLHAATWGSAR